MGTYAGVGIGMGVGMGGCHMGKIIVRAQLFCFACFFFEKPDFHIVDSQDFSLHNMFEKYVGVISRNK